MPKENKNPNGEKGKLRVINLFGSPGTGKSATRSGLFWLMKLKDMSVEEVSEYAKYLVLANRSWQLVSDQLYVVAKQHHKMLILEGVYDYAVTDSPLLLASFYAGAGAPETFHAMCRDYSDRYENLNFFLRRDLGRNFESEGRIHSLEDSKRIEMEQKEFLAKRSVEWIDIDLDHQTPWLILEHAAKRWPGSVPEFGPARPQWKAAKAGKAGGQG